MSSEILKKSQRNGGSSVLKLILTILLFVIIVLSAIFFGTRGSKESSTTNDHTDSPTEITTTSFVVTTTETTTEKQTQTTPIQTSTKETTTEIVIETTTNETTTEQTSEETVNYEDLMEKIKVDLLVKNKYSRPGTKLDSTEWIIVHYVANPGTTAQQNRNYFNGLATSHKASASAHFIIGLNGEIVQCLPLDEVSYNAGSTSYNMTSISIECCHPDSSGKFNQATYDTLVQLVSWLCQKYNLPIERVIRHYDVTGKACPVYWSGKEGSEQDDRWEQFLLDVVENK